MSAAHEFCLAVADLDALARVGARLGEALLPGSVVLLIGDLGAGKTTLTKYLAAALGVMHEVTSPTFTIAHTYECGPGAGVKQLMHLDAYRLRGADDLEAVGLFDALDDGAAAIIEWGDIVASAMPEPLVVSMAFVDDDHRSIRLAAEADSRWALRLASLAVSIGAAPC